MGRRALVVSEDFVRRNRWASLLRSEGFETATCPGPFVTSECPRLDDELCPLREWAHAAVVDVPEGVDTELLGGMPERACTTLPDDGRTVFLYRSTLPSDWHHGRNNLAHPVTDTRLVQAARSAARVVRLPDECAERGASGSGGTPELHFQCSSALRRDCRGVVPARTGPLGDGRGERGG